MMFVERTQDQYPGLDLDDVRLAFEEVKAEMLLLREEKEAKRPASNRAASIDNRQTRNDAEP